MSLSDDIIAQAFQGDRDHGEAVNMVALLTAIQHRVMCDCGAVLDVEKAVYIERPTKPEAPRATVVCGGCWDRMVKGGQLPDDLEVTDGRALDWPER